MKKIFTINRDTYRGLTTLGKITYPDFKGVRNTLEDCVRAYGIKDKKNTAIPFNTDTTLYKMQVSMSSRFKREMVMIFTEKDGYTLRAGGISFTGIRIHGGLDHLDTEGCVIAAKKRTSSTTVQGSVEAEITALVKQYESEGHECYLRVVNMAQKE